METAARERAVAAAKAVAESFGLRADDAVVLNDSNKLTLRLMPCDTVARVAPLEHRAVQFEIDIAQRLAEADCPVAALDPRIEPRVHTRDGCNITFWTHYEPVSAESIPPAEYARALGKLHTGMRTIDIAAPHFTDRVDEAQQILADRRISPDLPEPERALLADTLERLRRATAESGKDQLLHGEPHPGNLLATEHGPLFIDFETCCYGPVEFDLAHAPDALAEHYPGADLELLHQCRMLMLAMIITWRWDKDDQLPGGRDLGAEWLDQLRAALDAN
ncbi:phosphotransferase enzyme family protein [Glycomyces sp. NPDC048151]|uniref:phosphotransferase enzyme family protein n=1 Tax=Glycomyces sp. NPDC048151 TaxID=3364002 RepID=UPI00371F856B